MKSKMKSCPACGQQIAKSAKACPSCGAKIKKPIYKKWWFWVILLLLIGAVGGSGGSTDVSTTDPDTQEEAVIEYYECTADQLYEEMNANALSAEEKYDGLYVEVTGELSVIDSDGKYISISPMNQMFALSNVQCYVKGDEQLERIMELAVGDKVTVRGKITDVGEILGYTMNIDEIL